MTQADKEMATGRTKADRKTGRSKLFSVLASGVGDSV